MTPDKTSGLIWIQTVLVNLEKKNQRTTKISNEKLPGMQSSFKMYNIGQFPAIKTANCNNSCKYFMHTGIFACFFLSSADLFPKILPGTPPDCQTVWIQIRADVLSGLIWVQTVCTESL